MTTPAPAAGAVVGAPPRSRVARARPWLLGAGIAILASAAIWFYAARREQSNAPTYRTEAATRGNLVVTVSATGTLQPINQVDVGSELSGRIESVNVDDNDRVKKEQVIARLDVTQLTQQVAKSRASLAAAEANVKQMQATVQEARAALARFRQVAELSGGKVPSRAEMEGAEAALARAVANEAAAQAQVKLSAAALKVDETNLAKASIRSPIDGVVLARKVEPGQTVAASLQAPVLFTLAENLAQMELEVDVDEADVGQVRDGQAATFNVDAYPDRKYPARIKRVSYGSTTKDNVVTYAAVLQVDNDDLSLRPGMTATAEITTASRTDVLLVPNAALRYQPPAAAAGGGSGIVSSLMPRPPSTNVKQVRSTEKTAARRLWVLRNGTPAPVQVTVGATNGRYTEVTGGELKAGDPVITEAVARKK